MKRYLVELKVSIFAIDATDADQLAAMIRDRVDSLLGGGQAIVSIGDVSVDEETFEEA